MDKKFVARRQIKSSDRRLKGVPNERQQGGRDGGVLNVTTSYPLNNIVLSFRNTAPPIWCETTIKLFEVQKM